MIWLPLWTSAAFAITPAGTSISNQARLQFRVQNAPGEIQSNTVAFTVLQLLGVTLSSQDAGDVGVNSPDLSRVLSFRLTNIGNGAETYRLDRNDAVAGDNFDPVAAPAPAAGLFIENGRQIGFQATGPNADTPYVNTSSGPTLASGEERTVYLVSAIPSGQANLDRGLSRLIATSAQADVPGQQPGLALPPVDANGLQRVVGLSRGQADATGSYRVTGVQTLLTKTVAKVVDPQGGGTVMPGAVITYRLVAQLQGKGGAGSVTVSDVLPAQVRYKPGALRVNGALQTEAADTDPSEVNASASPQTLRVRLGSQSAPFLATVEFDVIVE